MSSSARFCRLVCCVGCLLGCTSDPDTPDSGGQTPDAGRGDAGAAAEGGSSGGGGEGGAPRDAGPDANPCADVDCSEDADECNRAACNPDTGECELTPLQDGTACGDSDESACNAADSCLAGECASNHAASGTSCGDSADSECDNPDSCDGAGACQDNLEATGTDCGDASDSECDNPDSCNDEGVCQHNREASGTDCGDASDGECDKPDSCDGAGACQDNREASGTNCGDASDNECDDPDSCDGAGTCQSHREASGTSCGDSANTACDNPDSCDGAGTCQSNREASGTTCGDSADTECDNPDSCNAFGTCVGNLATAGAPCGDSTDTACTNPDTCNGSGVCLANHAANATLCGDQGVTCHLNDSCNGSGVCSDAGLATEGSLCGDTRNDECHNPDVCDAAGLCQHNDEATGSRCRSCPGGVACECRHSVCVDRCSAFGAADYGYLGCDDSQTVPPCSDISDSGAALTLAAGGSAMVDIGFDFTLYGVTRRALQVYEDGLLSFGDGSVLPAPPECLAADVLSSTSGPAIAPFWTDFATGGAVHYQTTGIAPSRKFSVQWSAGHSAAGSSQPGDIRVDLSELGQSVRVCYVDTTFGSDADAGGLAVAGITDTAGTDPLGFSCHEPALPNATVIDYYCIDGCPFTMTSDFDELDDGDLLAASNPDWSGWNNAAAADSPVVDEQAHSAPNSLRVAANTDLVRPFDAGSTGVVVLSAMSYVPTGMTGSMWFIVLDTYYPLGAQHWVLEIGLDAATETVTDFGDRQPGVTPTPVPLVRDAWVEIVVTIDLSARTYSSTYNGAPLMTDRAWTLGATGSFHGAVDLFGVSIAPGGYFDDLTIEKLPAPECGNSSVEPGEQCDLGSQNSDAFGSQCDTTCQFGSLVSWLDGADPNGDGSPLADGAAVGTWVDKARANNAMQLDPARQPSYVATGLGTGALSFDGLNDFLDLPIDINTLAQPSMTVVAVIQNAVGQTSDLAGVWGNDNFGWDRFLVSGGRLGFNGISSGIGFVTVSGLTAESVPLITVATLVNGGASAVHINGRLGASFTENHSNPGTPTMSIGNLEGAAFPPRPVSSFDGLVAEFMLFDRALSRARRNQIGSALATKYGLTSYCGDGVTSGSEQCDDGVNDGTACSAICTSVP